MNTPNLGRCNTEADLARAIYILSSLVIIAEEFLMPTQDLKSVLSSDIIEMNDIFDFLPTGNSVYEERGPAAFANGLSTKLGAKPVPTMDQSMILKSSSGVKRPAPKKFVATKRAKIFTMTASSLSVSIDPKQQHWESAEQPPAPKNSGRTGAYFNYDPVLESRMLEVNLREFSALDSVRLLQ